MNIFVLSDLEQSMSCTPLSQHVQITVTGCFAALEHKNIKVTQVI